MDGRKEIFTVNSSEGEKLMIAGGEYRILVSGSQTGGSFAVIEMSVPPGAGPAPHSHPDFEESFYVLEGEVTFRSGSGSFVAAEKAYISIPKGGIIHAFKNLSDRPAKLLCTVIPAGLDDFFREMAKLMAQKSSYSASELKEQVDQISAKFGQKMYDNDYQI